VDRRDDGEAERRRKLELTGIVIRSFRCTRAKLGRLGSTSGSRRCSRSTGSGMGGGSGGFDSEQKLRRRSGEVWCSGEEMSVEMQMRESKRECVGSSRMCSGFRRRCGHAGAGAGKPAGVVAARAAVARRGEARREPARGGKRRRRCWGGTGREERRHGGGRCAAHGRRGWRGRAEKKTEEED
jgi:hypothetical protein